MADVLPPQDGTLNPGRANGKQPVPSHILLPKILLFLPLVLIPNTILYLVQSILAGLIGVIFFRAVIPAAHTNTNLKNSNNSTPNRLHTENGATVSLCEPSTSSGKRTIFLSRSRTSQRQKQARYSSPKHAHLSAPLSFVLYVRPRVTRPVISRKPINDKVMKLPTPVKRTNVVIRRPIRFWHRHLTRLCGHSPRRHAIDLDPPAHPPETSCSPESKPLTSHAVSPDASQDAPMFLESAGSSETLANDIPTEPTNAERVSLNQSPIEARDKDVPLSGVEALPPVPEHIPSAESEAASLADLSIESSTILSEDRPIVSEPLEMLQSPSSPVSTTHSDHASTPSKSLRLNLSHQVKNETPERNIGTEKVALPLPKYAHHISVPSQRASRSVIYTPTRPRRLSSAPEPQKAKYIVTQFTGLGLGRPPPLALSPIESLPPTPVATTPRVRAVSSFNPPTPRLESMSLPIDNAPSPNTPRSRTVSSINPTLPTTPWGPRTRVKSTGHQRSPSQSARIQEELEFVRGLRKVAGAGTVHPKAATA